MLDNIHSVQRHQNLPLSAALIGDKKTVCPINLDIEMETGTGKTYCYIKTVFELNKHYGWSKFVVVVPSIAIREGVYKSLPAISCKATAKKCDFLFITPGNCTTWKAFPPTQGSMSCSSTS